MSNLPYGVLIFLVGMLLGNMLGDDQTMADCRAIGIAKMISGGYIQCKPAP